MKFLSGVMGVVLGLTLFGLMVLAGTSLGLSSGPGWWVLGVPFVGLIAYLAVIEK